MGRLYAVYNTSFSSTLNDTFDIQRFLGFGISVFFWAGRGGVWFEKPTVWNILEPHRLAIAKDPQV